MVWRIFDQNEWGFYILFSQIFGPDISPASQPIRFVLIQSAYKFMWDIAQIETKVVNDVAEKIANDGFEIQFSDALKFNALTVLVDESYHAYVARDFLYQLEEVTKIAPIKEVFCPTGLYVALQKSCDALPKREAVLFKLVAISIAENSITSSLIDLNKTADDEVNTTFYIVNRDHMIDEARHSKIFKDILSFSWQQFSMEDKRLIGAEIPAFIRMYLDSEYQRELSVAMLQELNVPNEKIKEIVENTHPEYTKENFKTVNPVVKNIIDFLQRSKVLDYQPTQELFRNEGLF